MFEFIATNIQYRISGLNIFSRSCTCNSHVLWFARFTQAHMQAQLRHWLNIADGFLITL